MADGKFLIGKPAGGVTTVTMTDGASNTNLVLPESGTVSGVTTAVTDNAIPRFDDTTGKLQNSGIVVADNNEITISGSSGNIVINPLGGGNSIKFSRNGANYITANGGTSSALYFSTGHTGEYYENQKMVLDNTGNLLLTSGTGTLGYGTGAGGTVTQLTSKSTAVTLNKPSGRIVMHNASLANGARAAFTLANSLIESTDIVDVQGYFSGSGPDPYNYKIEIKRISNGSSTIIITNEAGSSLSDALQLNFTVFKGANS